MRRKRVLRFVTADAFLFALLFSTQFIVRTALDWFMPTADFHARATVSTVLSAVILLAAGFSASNFNKLLDSRATPWTLAFDLKRDGALMQCPHSNSGIL
jgi:heme/copper-type cytochrome/quinol oxidase subunit 3